MGVLHEVLTYKLVGKSSFQAKNPITRLYHIMSDVDFDDEDLLCDLLGGDLNPEETSSTNGATKESNGRPTVDVNVSCTERPKIVTENVSPEVKAHIAALEAE